MARTIAVFVAVALFVVGGFALHASRQVNEGIIDDVYMEAEKRWWTHETECKRWQTITHVCTNIDGTVRTCSSTRCAYWHPYEQEWIDDEDYVINVLGEDAWGDMKMRRVYLPQSTWSGLQRGSRWTAKELPDIGDDKQKGERKG